VTLKRLSTRLIAPAACSHSNVRAFFSHIVFLFRFQFRLLLRRRALPLSYFAVFGLAFLFTSPLILLLVADTEFNQPRASAAP
jgi:hypothetical protein